MHPFGAIFTLAVPWIECQTCCGAKFNTTTRKLLRPISGLDADA